VAEGRTRPALVGRRRLRRGARARRDLPRPRLPPAAAVPRRAAGGVARADVRPGDPAAHAGRGGGARSEDLALLEPYFPTVRTDAPEDAVEVWWTSFGVPDTEA
jgi:hypothetical protein